MRWMGKLKKKKEKNWKSMYDFHLLHDPLLGQGRKSILIS